jgi:plastocyanin
LATFDEFDLGTMVIGRSSVRTSRLVIALGLAAGIACACAAPSAVTPEPTAVTAPQQVRALPTPSAIPPTPTPAVGFTPEVSQRNSAGVPVPSAPGAVNVVVTYTPVPAGAAAPKSGLISISVGDNYFSPEEVHVTVGSTVEWVYNGGGGETESTHNVVGGSFNSGDLSPNSKYTYTFEQPGEFDYVCTYHAKQMTGKVFVE